MHEATGALDEAFQCHEEARTIREKCLGLEHADTAHSLGRLGAVCRRKGKLNKALEYFHVALAINEKVLGADHVGTAVAAHNLGAAFQRLGEPRMALEHLQRSVAALETQEVGCGNRWGAILSEAGQGSRPHSPTSVGGEPRVSVKSCRTAIQWGPEHRRTSVRKHAPKNAPGGARSIGRNSPKLGRVGRRIGRNPPLFAQSSSSSGSSDLSCALRAKVGRLRPQMGFGQHGSEFSQLRPNVGRDLAFRAKIVVGRHVRNSGQNWSKFARRWSSKGELWPGPDQPTSPGQLMPLPTKLGQDPPSSE